MGWNMYCVFALVWFGVERRVFERDTVNGKV